MADRSIKTAFIIRCLRDYLAEVQDTMPTAGAQYGMKPDGKGFQSIRFEMSEDGEGMQGKLYFHEYMRMVDMGVGRGKPLGTLTTKITQPRTAKAGRVFIKDRTFKPKKMYARVAYGKLNWLEGRLMYGLTDEVIAQLKEEMGMNNE